ncbi:MAG: CotH kinase family protein [Lachnospiraceae bacterium]|nr:CotH kinase family protein [Lachnospiraceae bacterium]
MYKKYVAGISIGLILAVLLLMNILQENKFALFNPVSSERAEEVWSGRTRVERFEFGNLLCNEIQVPVDYVEKTFYIPLNMETEEWETLEFTSGKPEYQILFSEDFTKYDKKQLLRDNADIEFLVYNDVEFSTYHIRFTGLPVIDISTAGGIENQKEIAGNAVFYDTNFSTQGIQNSEYNGHVRGNMSTLFPKKGYKINLTKQRADGVVENNKLSLFGMREDDDWILSALYNDESKLREAMCIELWNQMGGTGIYTNSNYNTTQVFVELLVDEAYYGMYALKEPIDAKQLNLQSDDYLYKRENPEDLEAEVFAQANDPLEHVLGFEIKEGVLDETAWQPMAELAELLNVDEEEFAENVSSMLDEDNAMRLWLYIQLIAGYDQQKKNVFYVARHEGDSYYFTFAPWDLDLTYGHRSDANPDTLYTRYDEGMVTKYFHWETGDRLIRENVNGAADKMQKLYGELRKTVLSDEAIEAQAAQFNHVVRDSGAYIREQQRWPESALAENAEIVLNFAKERMAYLDTALYDLEYFLNQE